MVCFGKSILGEVNIRRGKSQGDSLSQLSLFLRLTKPAYQFLKGKKKINHLLFVDDLKLYTNCEKGLDLIIQTVKLFSDYFSIYKRGVLVMKGERIVKLKKTELPDGKVYK